MKKIIFLILIIYLVLPSFSQEKKKPAKAEKPVPTVAETETIQDELGKGYIYKPMGRRDPFWDPLRGTKENIRTERSGVAGLTINELTLEGIINSGGEFIGLFRGPDNRPYQLRIGTQVYDGEVIRIDINAVTFRQSVLVPTGTRERTIIKNINPEEENKK
jgi:Tfp pilus assembly protein PilP